MEEEIEFVNDLPHKLKLELSIYLYKKTYTNINFLRTQSKVYVSWICPLLRTILSSENECLYYEGDDIQSIYFVKEGQCGFVLPKYGNIKYVNIGEGLNFGLIDIAASALSNDYPMDDFY